MAGNDVRSPLPPPRRELPAQTRSKEKQRSGAWVAAAAALGTVVVLAGATLIIRSALEAPRTENKRKLSDPVEVRLTVDANLPVRVFVKHPTEERSKEKVTELGEAPLRGATGAHVGDTVLLANPVQDAFYEETIPFGEPGMPVRVVKEFKTGHVKFRLPAGTASSLFVYLNDLQVAPYSAQVQIELTEGKHTLEIRGAGLEKPVPVQVEVRPGEVTEVDPPPSLLKAVRE